MKAYIIKIELEESNPLIWRKVIMPAGATYKRLHDIIQNVSNFQSGYPFGGYHLYEFDLTEENKIVTDNEEAYIEHKHYVKNKKYYEKQLKNMEPDMKEYEKKHQERLKIEVRKPSGLKIDDYLEKYKEIRYNYDFGDNWWFTIKLKEIVYDYYFGFPTLLHGAEIAPPEDIGGIHGFYDFLEAYRNPKNSEHKKAIELYEEWQFREYDPDFINDILKSIRYKKTEWDKINHDYYKIIEDKYRKK